MSGSTLVLEVAGIEGGTFQKEGKGPDVPYLRVWGYALPNGRWASTISYGDRATALHAELKAGAAPGEAPEDRHPVIKAEGAWTERRRPGEDGAERVQRSFRVDKFEILTGPALELQKQRRQGAKALKDAGKALKGGELMQAYLMLEAYVARVARAPQPSVEMGPAALPEAGALSESEASGPAPEETALARYAEIDAKRLGRVPEASVPEAPSEPASVRAEADTADPALPAETVAESPEPVTPSDSAEAQVASAEADKVVADAEAAVVVQAEPAATPEAAVAEDVAADAADGDEPVMGAPVEEAGEPVMGAPVEPSRPAEGSASDVEAVAEVEAPAVTEAPAEAKPPAAPAEQPKVESAAPVRPTFPVRPVGSVPGRPALPPAG